ncbi:6-pyruvoyl trahydropterin synthase family protein [Paracraurococcus ruber]|uniref:6-carboxy-5,6,7,8-tetrahydropterin synthase n=1 Tax=Paracraurococcus ruber TaxID=77675 RepID=A0ABS1CUP8_9PROT|nr:6-carboxytetrahydropterin synthase [Paracraurococcus ruber]MBK1658230.1 6-pyruvoyl tetrahydropterin synthase [Paracraurococcus ruber]TDG30599.1 6-carboxytetrahydropterin synthase [Paracraurococcus ruber]
MLELVFRRRFAMAHRLLLGGSEQCAVPHGHTETVTVRLRATGPAPLDGAANMVEPFARAKGTWHRWIDTRVDHALQLAATDPLLRWFRAEEPHRLDRILVTPGDPTTELLCCLFAAKLGAFLAAEGGRLAVAAVEIEETPTNSVRFAGDPLDWLPAREGWWRRPDMSINDIAVPRDRAA